MYRDHGAAVYGMAHRLCGGALGAEVTQDVFLGYWRHPERFDPTRSSLRSFLLMMARQRAIDALRSESARRRREHRSALSVPTVTPDADQVLVDQERSATVMAAISALTAPEREAVLAAYYGDRTYREVAQVLGVPLGTIKSRIRTGLAKLRQALGDAPSLHADEAAA